MEREEDIVFIDITENNKSESENNIKQRKIKKLEFENNNLRYQLEDLRSELQRSNTVEPDLFDEITISINEIYIYMSKRISEMFSCF